MKLIKLIIATAITLTTAFGITKDEIKGIVKNKVSEALVILSDKSIQEKDKLNMLFAIFDPMFDYRQMAKISLGKRFNTLTKDEQDKFSKAFEMKLKNSYIDKIKSYSSEKINIKEAKEPQANRYFLNGELISDGKVYEFVYKFYDAKDRGWLIYDIDLIGISIIQTYRSQFADIMENTDFDTLLKKLNTTNEK